jgi:hypothetical protein
MATVIRQQAIAGKIYFQPYSTFANLSLNMHYYRWMASGDIRHIAYGWGNQMTNSKNNKHITVASQLCLLYNE